MKFYKDVIINKRGELLGEYINKTHFKYLETSLIKLNF
jgi:hypothetical protein